MDDFRKVLLAVLLLLLVIFVVMKMMTRESFTESQWQRGALGMLNKPENFGSDSEWIDKNAAKLATIAKQAQKEGYDGRVGWTKFGLSTVMKPKSKDKFEPTWKTQGLIKTLPGYWENQKKTWKK